MIATGFKVVENSHSPLQPRVGETMTLKCKTRYENHSKVSFYLIKFQETFLDSISSC